MLVVMGRTWLSASDQTGRRRLSDPNDFVRLEIAKALERDIAVIPVLVDSATLPKAEELPRDIVSLLFRQSTTVRHESFAKDMEGLERDLRAILREPRSTARMTMVAAGAVAVLAAGGALYFLNTGEVGFQPTPLATLGSQTPSGEGTLQVDLPSRQREPAVEGNRYRSDPETVAATVIPSFDCQIDKGPDEQTVCRLPQLARMDIEVDRRFKDLRGRLGQPGKDQLRDQQRLFLQRRKACGGNEQCITDLYVNRIEELKARGGG